MVSSRSLDGPWMVSSCSLEGPETVDSYSLEGPGTTKRFIKTINLGKYTAVLISPMHPLLHEMNKHHKSKNKSTRWAGPSTKALMEIRKYQKGTNLLIPRLPFHRLVKQIVQEFYTADHYSVFRMGKYALEALQESAEAYMVQFMEDAFLCTLHSKRVTLQQRDLQLVRRIRGQSDVINR
uniref:Core Histone H2A/H2B/H3 domain-containing protein n=1 Tax=Timema monikensis TaxID=170555 RepID=A0A7R9HP65_9NEOP|nr:unnamed protein product [Timema monikensis]